LTTVQSPVHLPCVYFIMAVLFPRPMHLASQRTEWTSLPTQTHWTHTHTHTNYHF